MHENNENYGEDDQTPNLIELLNSLGFKSAFNTGLAHDPLAEDVMPSKEQLDLKPGDLCAITHGEDITNEFTVAEIASPEDYAETFPDWETRLLKSYLLVIWRSKSNPVGSPGWVPRTRLIKFSRREYEIMLGWMHGDDRGDDAPFWLKRRYNEALVGIAAANPDKVPMPISCPECGSVVVIIRLIRNQVEDYCMGRFPESVGVTGLHPVTTYNRRRSGEARLICEECGHEEVLSDDEEIYTN
jgi:hypothetical protein